MLQIDIACKWKVTEVPSIDALTAVRLNGLRKRQVVPVADDKKTLKFQMMMSPSEAETLDDWMFKHRIRSRAEAIRRLCQIALEVQKSVSSSALFTLRTSKVIGDLSDKLTEELPNKIGEEEAKPFLYAAHDARLSAAHAWYQVGGIMAAYSAYLKDGEVNDVIAQGREQIDAMQAAQKELTEKYKLQFMEYFTPLHDSDAN